MADFTVTTDLITVDNCEALSGGGFGTWTAQGGSSLAVETIFIQGAGSVAIKVSNTNKWMRFTPTSSVNLSSRHLYWWCQVTTPNILDAINAATTYIEIGDGTNLNQYAFIGSDTYNGGWKRFVLDTSKSRTAGSGTLDLTAVTYLEWTFTTSGTTKSPNCFIDAIHSLNAGEYSIKCAEGNVSSEGTWTDIVAADDLNGWGVAQERAGIVYSLGPILFGNSSGASNTYFLDSNRIIVFDDPTYHDSSSNVSSISTDFYAIDFAGHSSTTTDIQFGQSTGSGQDIFGFGGGTITTAGGQKYTWDSEIDAADVDIIKISGTQFIGAGVMQFDKGAGQSQDCISCTWDNCATVQYNEADIINCNFLNCIDTQGAVEMLDAGDDNLTYCLFRNCLNGIYFPFGASTTRDFVGLDIGSTTFDIYNDSNVAGVIINADTNTTVDETENPAGKSIVVVNSKTLTIHVEDVDGADIEAAQVYIQKASPTAITAANNTANVSSVVVNGPPDSDTPQIGWLIVLDKSENETLPYRYASWSSNTFSLPTEVTAACTGGGSGTLLEDNATTDFVADDVEEGDTIRNVTDGSWAVIDEINNSNAVTTSSLQDGGDNTWTSGDVYSLHKLALSLVNGDDTVDIPLTNQQTSALGVITQGYNYTGDLPIIIRVRGQEGATKYIPFSTSATVEGDLSLNVVLAEDVVAT